MVGLVVLLALILAGIVYFIGIYNSLVAIRERVKQDWANIDVLLKQRHDELPKLVDACRQYMQYEQETLERVMRARSAVQQASAGGNIAAVGAAEQQLRGDLGRLFAVAENYPDLKANQNVLQLQEQLTTTENQISFARQHYNATVLDYNTATLVKDWWGEWAQQVSKMPPKDVGLTEPMTVEKIAASNPSCVGVARTHELFVGWYAGAQDEARSRTWHARFQNPPVVYPDPKWTCHVDERVFWPMAAKGEFGPQHAELEDFITRWFDEFMVRQELFPMSGWYDWMKLPLLRWWKDESQGNRVYAQWYRSAIDGLYEANKFITIGWARSGDRRLLDAARRFNRWQTDNKVVHWGGGRDKRVRGYLNASPSQFPPSWRPGSGRPTPTSICRRGRRT